jgi:sigma-B regulation protein RsbU (phosphoserine phosphatase)
MSLTMDESSSSWRGTPAAAESGAKRKLLIVDDEAINLKLLRVTLTSSGFEVVEAKNGREALARIDEADPDLILLDIMMPGMDGYEVCQRVRAHPKHQGLPVLMLTALNQLEDRVKALEVGADDFITKPFNKVELLARVHSLLRVKNLYDRLEERNIQLQDANQQFKLLNRELTSRNHELEMGLEMAHKLQEAFLPQKYPRIENATFCHKYMPTEAVGGDFFEILPFGEQQVAVFVADVSGHGVRAALITSVVKALFDDIFLNEQRAEAMLSEMNRRFRVVLGSLVPQIYCTASYMTVHGPSRKLEVVSAGHPSPLLIDRESDQVCQMIADEDTAPAIGFMTEIAPKVISREMKPGDVVLGFTDGLFEVHDGRGEEYGVERVTQFITDNRQSIPRELIQKLITDTETFMGSDRRPDDVCVVATEFC